MSAKNQVPIDERIAANREMLSLRGGFPPHYLDQSMTASKECSPGEIAWVKGFRRLPQNTAGLVFLGAHQHIQTRMMLMSAAFTRNFIQARVASLHQVMDSLKAGDDDFSECTVLLIPNFFVMTHGKVLTGWQVGMLHGLLTHRFINGKKTVLYVESFDRMLSDYQSPELNSLITSNYSQVRATNHV